MNTALKGTRNRIIVYDSTRFLIKSKHTEFRSVFITDLLCSSKEVTPSIPLIFECELMVYQFKTSLNGMFERSPL